MIISPIDPDWPEHKLAGIRMFKGRLTGHLTVKELKLLKEKWIPSAIAQWDRATDEQKADYHALINALSAHNLL